MGAVTGGGGGWGGGGGGGGKGRGGGAARHTSKYFRNISSVKIRGVAATARPLSVIFSKVSSVSMVYCSVLQCVAVCYSVCIHVSCSELQ